MSTIRRALLPGAPCELGYRRLVACAGEEPVVRRELGGAADDRGARLRSLLAFVHLSDLHVTDVQSPARAEFLDRLGDEDSPFAAVLGRVGTYRAQEALTHQVVEAMARAVRAALAGGGPATGTPFAFAVSTGDNTDNSQRNELDAYLALLDGGREVVPDSGDPERYEGVGCAELYDERYWHPDGTPEGQTDDRPRARHGFPTVPGLLDACRRPFVASGLGLPWYAVYGNHDALLVGTEPPGAALAELAVGAEKTLHLRDGLDPVALIGATRTGPSPAAWGMLGGDTVKVTPDPLRRLVGAGEWLAAHLHAPGEPPGHGITAQASAAGRAYYAADAGIVRLLVLDSVNRAGGWQGSLDAEQLGWLEAELVAGHARHLDTAGHETATGSPDRLFLLVAHHSVETLTNPCSPPANPCSPPGAPRALGEDLLRLLERFPNVVAFVNGHTHVHAVRAFPAAARRGGFWQLTTASHIDWPQQARLVELALDAESGDVLIASVLLDHAGLADPREGDLADPLTLAGWSRELSLNAWQGRSKAEEPWGRGERADRNVVLVWPAPFDVAASLDAMDGA